MLEVELLFNDPEAQHPAIFTLGDLLDQVAVLIFAAAGVTDSRLGTGSSHRTGKGQPQQKRRLLLHLLKKDDRIPGLFLRGLENSPGFNAGQVFPPGHQPLGCIEAKRKQ